MILTSYQHMIVNVCLDFYSRHFKDLIHEYSHGGRIITRSMGVIKTSTGEIFIDRRPINKSDAYHFNVSSPNFSMKLKHSFDHYNENPDAAVFVVDHYFNDFDDLWRINVLDFKYRVITTQEQMEEDFVFMRIGV